MNKLKSYRVKKELTQKQVATQASITERNYQYYECGERTPNARTAIRIAKVLDSTVEELWDGNPTKQATPLV